MEFVEHLADLNPLLLVLQLVDPWSKDIECTSVPISECSTSIMFQLVLIFGLSLNNDANTTLSLLCCFPSWVNSSRIKLLFGEEDILSLHILHSNMYHLLVTKGKLQIGMLILQVAEEG